MRNGYPLTDRIMRTHNHRVVSLCLMSVFTLLVARDLHAAERTFCQGEECTPDNFKVRFGNLGEERSTTQALAGEIIELRVTIDVVSEVQGWNFGLSHDTSKLEIIEATSESLGLPETFFNATVISMPDNNGNPSPGLVSGVILAINAQGQEMLTPGDEVMVLTARYRVIGELDEEDPSFIQFTDNLRPGPGAPKTITALTIGEQTRPPAKVVDGEVLARKGNNDAMPFNRADCNGDGRVNFTDVIVNANNIFLGKNVFFDCDNMLDANDDGLLDGSDPIRILDWFFVGDQTIPEPFLNCGLDDDSELECAFSNCLCDNYGFYFGKDPNTPDFNLNGAAVIPITMRNSSPVQGFSMGVEVTQNGERFTFVDGLLGIDDDRRVALTIVDHYGEARKLDRINIASGQPAGSTILAVERGAATAEIGDFFLSNLNPSGGTGFTVTYATSITGADDVTIPPSPIENGSCRTHEIVQVRTAITEGLPTWAFLFGRDPDGKDVDLGPEELSVELNMRNADDVLGFSMGVQTVDGVYTFADKTLGKVEDRLVDLLIADVKATEHLPETNSLRDDLQRTIVEIERGDMLEPSPGDFFTVDLAPKIGGQGFTVGYATDTIGTGLVIPANSGPEDFSQILRILYEIDDTRPFKRGDCNGDGRLNITDGALCAQNIFLNRLKAFDCDDMLDANDDNELDMTDPITILIWIFLNGESLPQPFMSCGEEDDSVDTLRCLESNCSP